MRKLVICLVAMALVAAVQPAGAQTNAPGLMYSTLLNGVQILSEDGRFRLDNIQAVFLPEAQSAGNSTYPYNPDDGGKIWAVLSRADGRQLFRFDFYGEKLKQPYWLLSSYRAADLQSGAQAETGFVNLAQPGSYVLDFYLESGKFYSFPFSVKTMPSPDPFSGGDQYVMDGPWASWGYFFYPEADSTKPLQFKLWLRSPQHGEAEAKPLLQVYRGDKLVATGRDMSITLQPRWVRYDLDVIFPSESVTSGSYMKAGDLLKTDGDYVLKLKLNGQLYGEWPFKVSGGRFVYAGRAIRGQADPLGFIEGGRDAFWYEKRK